METLTKLNSIFLIATAGLMMACSSGTDFSLNSENSVFQQSVTRTQVKVDILWVIDNSGSMATSQANVAANFQSFIQKFQQTNFDYQMAVTTTEAWRAPVDNDPTLSRYRDGNDTVQTGVRIIKPDTPNLQSVFIENIQQGTAGSGDERGWQSMKQALEDPANQADGFPRPDALLAVIILTDEDDFSHDGNNNLQVVGDYNDPALHDPMDYFNFLSTLTNSTPDNLNFQVNTIGIFDDACRQQLNTTFTGRRIAQRYIGVTDATGGYKGSLCDDFSDVLAGISDSIIERSTAFKLPREPNIETIVVKVDGVVIPMDPVNGWTYEPSTMLIVFNGTSIPGSEQIVSITYDPVGLK